MSSDILAYSLSQHPAPHRARVSLGAIFYGLFAAPVVWSGDLMATYALVSHACYPGNFPLRAADTGFGWVWPVVLAFHLIALLLIASGWIVAFRMWRVTGPPEGHHHQLMEVGEGRTRYLGICGMGFATLFFFIAMTETISLALVPLCSL